MHRRHYSSIFGAAVAIKSSLSILLFCTISSSFVMLVAAEGTNGEPGPLKVGEEYGKNISPSEDSEIIPEITENGKSAMYSLRHTGASYIAVHFSDFNLPEGCTMKVSGDPITNIFEGVSNGKQEYSMTGLGKMEMRTFWSQHVKGGSIVLKVRCEMGNARDKGWFSIDKYAAGYSNLEAFGNKNGGNRMLLRHNKDTASFDHYLQQQNERRAAICGVDDKENAICYSGSHTIEYSRSSAVARLLIEGSWLCTGWLASSNNHLITNEHCISSNTAAMNTDYEFMAQASNCNDVNCQMCHGGETFSGGTLVQDNASLDYALVQITSGNPASTYGVLEIDNRDAVVNELIVSSILKISE